VSYGVKSFRELPVNVTVIVGIVELPPILILDGHAEVIP
jgi:hypothetical protein